MKPCISILLLTLAAPFCFAQGIAKSLNDQPQISGQPPLTAERRKDLETSVDKTTVVSGRSHQRDDRYPRLATCR